MPYRTDIDGLRAVAVLAVVLFHAFPGFLPGGFVGVDVFFAISGYLITGLIVDDLGAGRFSVLTFYQRRIRRIFPALLIMLVFCGAAGWWLLMSFEYRELGSHIASASVFASNFTLLSESGYFDEAANTKPLLHLWSLAIEEQFYVVWPLLLWLAIRTGITAMRLACIGATLSFAICVLLSEIDSAAAFYQPAARAWELLAGAILAIAERDHTPVPWRRLTGWRWLPWGGFVAIVASSILFDQRTPFPGCAALIPVLGTLAILAAAPSSHLTAWLGTTRWLVWVGLISYPLYLWHWPLLSFARIVGGRTAPSEARAVLVACSIALAWLTYRSVEASFRAPRLAVKKVLALLTVMAIAGFSGQALHAHEGVPQRGSIAAYEEKFRELHKTGWPRGAGIACADSFAKSAPSLRYCERSRADDPKFAIFGDSHADHLFHGVAKVDSANSWLLIGHNSTPPLLDVQINIRGYPQDNQARSRKVVRYLAADRTIKTILIAFYGNTYLSDTPFSVDQQLPENSHGRLTMSSSRWPTTDKTELIYLGLNATVHALRAAGKEVVLVMDVPELPFLPQDCIGRPGAVLFQRSCELPRQVVELREAEFRQLLARVASNNPGVVVYDPTSLMCDPAFCRFESTDALLYRDSNHLTMTGSEYVASGLLAWLSKQALNCSRQRSVARPPNAVADETPCATSHYDDLRGSEARPVNP
jgi:peptidoglycan/LPS O-acetylase OafA/YrhL